MNDDHNYFVLASGSGIRQKLLRDAGLPFLVDPADIDERAIEATYTEPSPLALRLAEEKARLVSERHPQSLVLGSDQVFSLHGKMVSKPENRPELVAKLFSLSGETHDFHCGFALAKGGEILHSAVDPVRVSFYSLSAKEIEDYADTKEGLGCAGGYRLEEGGVRLIRQIEGSHFTVLGLPMMPLIAWLRETGELDRILGAQPDHD